MSTGACVTKEQVIDVRVEGVQYFTCRAKHAVFIRPEKVTIGDFPEEDLLDDSDDEI